MGDLLTVLCGSRKYKLSEKMSKLLGFMCEVKLGSGRKEGRKEDGDEARGSHGQGKHPNI